jgi:hypothetical protein
MSRRIKIGLGVMALVTAGSLMFFLDLTDRIRAVEDPSLEAGFGDEETPLFEPSDPPLGVKLFWPATSNDLLLRTRDVTIFASAAVGNRVRQIVDQLIRGGDTQFFGNLPEGTRLVEVFVSEQGTAYLDFNSAISDNHPGGVLPEMATIYSIVNSLTYNLEEVERVKILIGGVEKETLAGHCLLLLPLELDLTISDIAAASAVL